MLENLLERGMYWMQTMTYEEYLIVVVIAIALGFGLLMGFGSRRHF